MNGSLVKGKKMNKGFSIVEVIITIAVIGLISVILISKILGAQDAATTVKCLAELDAFATEVNALSLTGPAPTQKQVRDHIDWDGRYKNYWYIPNNADANSGHGNDLDGCDNDNPGKSLPGRECIPMRFVVVCQHTTHGNTSDAKYCFKVDNMPPQIVPYEEFRHTYLQDAKWWPGKDPGFDKWIGKAPKK
jgi:prepilin-type N-terminal cleavage/methylation domain-containing protein